MRLFGIWLSKPDIRKLTEKKKVRALGKALSYPDLGIRAAAATALAELEDPEAISPLQKALNQALQAEERSPRMIARFALALCNLGDLSAKETLIASIENKELATEWDLLEGSAMFLQTTTGDSRGFDTLCTILAYTKASEFAFSAEKKAMGAAISALPSSDSNRAVEILCAEYPGSKMKHEIIKALTPIADKRAVETLCAALTENSIWGLTAAIVTALKRIGDPRGIEEVKKFEQRVAENKAESRRDSEKHQKEQEQLARECRENFDSLFNEICRIGAAGSSSGKSRAWQLKNVSQAGGHDPEKLLQQIAATRHGRQAARVIAYFWGMDRGHWA